MVKHGLRQACSSTEAHTPLALELGILIQVSISAVTLHVHWLLSRAVAGMDSEFTWLSYSSGEFSDSEQ